MRNKSLLAIGYHTILHTIVIAPRTDSKMSAAVYLVKSVRNENEHGLQLSLQPSLNAWPVAVRGAGHNTVIESAMSSCVTLTSYTRVRAGKKSTAG